MPKSPFFVRIREHVLELTEAIPHGRVCTYQSIGEYLDVMPRHVAYILSQLEDSEKMVCPWHRVVAGDQSLGTLKTRPDGKTQADLLRAEGVLVGNSRIESTFARVFVAAEALPSGLPRQVRPADAPMPQRGRSRPRDAR